MAELNSKQKENLKNIIDSNSSKTTGKLAQACLDGFFTYDDLIKFTVYFSITNNNKSEITVDRLIKEINNCIFKVHEITEGSFVFDSYAISIETELIHIRERLEDLQKCLK